MNNGVNNQTVTNTNQDNANTITPMAGVKIAPPSSEPVNASNAQTSTAALQRNVSGSNISTQVSQPAPVAPRQTQQPVSSQPTATQPQQQPMTPQPPITPPPQVNQQNQVVEPPKKKKKFSLTPILLFIIIALGAYLYYSTNSHTMQIKQLMYNCTPITASKETIKLDLNSTLVQDLYNKVKTTIREDYANNELNDSMRIYLAYRQVPDSLKYSSNCNLFQTAKMEPFKCDSFNNFEPRAIKEETIQLELKKLFGEKSNIPLQNIQLGSSCIGGYEYIPERKEFVQGYCSSQSANFFKADKELIEANSTRNTIVLVEDVKYHENEKMSLPEYLKSGLYYYTFRLDLNYNYVLVSKTYKSKY